MTEQKTATEIIKQAIHDRMAARLRHIGFNEFMNTLDLTDAYVCGNACNAAKPNDYDVYLTAEELAEFRHKKLEDMKDIKVAAKTKNSITFIFKESTVIQVCTYNKPSLQELINSFDFSYCRVGVTVTIDPETDWLKIEEVAITDEYIQYLASGVTEYIGSEYPMSSMIRVVKINEKGMFNGRSYIRSILTILNDIMKRGVSYYDDFKDQLDAVDLGLAPEDLKGIGDVIKQLYVRLMLCGKQNPVDVNKMFDSFRDEDGEDRAEIIMFKEMQRERRRND
jgi:hypothetical protein